MIYANLPKYLLQHNFGFIHRTHTVLLKHISPVIKKLPLLLSSIIILPNQPVIMLANFDISRQTLWCHCTFAKIFTITKILQSKIVLDYKNLLRSCQQKQKIIVEGGVQRSKVHFWETIAVITLSLLRWASKLQFSVIIMFLCVIVQATSFAYFLIILLFCNHPLFCNHHATLTLWMWLCSVYQ